MTAIANTKTIKERFDDKWIHEANSGCWLWIGFLNPRDRARFGHAEKSRTAARVSWELYRGPIPSALCVLHKCDCPACVNPDHLFLGTHQDNMTDMRIKGRSRYIAHLGSKNGSSKLSETQVTALLSKRANGQPLNHRKEAERLKVSEDTIRLILLRKTWRHCRPA